MPTFRPRRGFSLPEVLMALTIGVVVLSAAIQFSVSLWKGRRGLVVREGVDRSARFVGLSLGRDVAEAGVALESTADFASVNGVGDTLTILSIPFSPDQAAVYPMKGNGGGDDDDDDDDDDEDDDDDHDDDHDEYDGDEDDEHDDGEGDEDDGSELLPPGGTCGATCIDFSLNGQAQELKAGDVALLRVGQSRRLLRITGVSAASGGKFQVTFANITSLAGRPSGLGTLRLRKSETSIQRVQVVAYYRTPSTGTLYRATSFSATGVPAGVEVATPVEVFTPRLRFQSGALAQKYNGADADTLNDGDRIVGVEVRAKMKAERTDTAVTGGAAVTRWYQWHMAPRNLLYEKNRG